MEKRTVAEVYAANERIHEKLKKTVENLSAEAAGRRAGEGKWSVAELVEHISLVDEKMAIICGRLLSKAQADNKTADGRIELSEHFLEKTAEAANAKLNAPEIVHPSEGRTIAESLARMAESQKVMADLLPAFEAFDGSSYKFPHPAFGDMSAQEWLALRGGHEARHLKQIEAILEEFGQ